MRVLWLWNACLLLSLVPSSTLAAVLAIDYGSDFIKASLMKPGIPFDVLLNKDSKRKIQSTVGWKKSDRLFGADAYNLASRFPSDSFSSVKFLTAVPYGSELASYYKSISVAETLETSRKTVALRQSDGTQWSTEELIAMQLSYVKSLAETEAGEKITDTIITVPPYYSQFERDAIADAIEIAGLRTLALINDGTAVAVNYAMTRTFPEDAEYHVVYDAGASSIRASVMSFSTDKKTGTTQITAHGVGYDRKIGGTEMDRRLREILIEKFNAKSGGRDIRKDKRGMAKLWKEANRVKAILSANTEAISTVESLAFDIDFKARVTRSEFEAACADIKTRFAQPIRDALEQSNLSLSSISSVIFTGGSTRAPMVQAAVKATVGEGKIALNVNADEAAVLGAGLYGAGLSRQFKTKDIKVNDLIAHDVQATYFAATTSTNVRPRSITTSIFPAGSKTGTKKTLTFKRKEDFSIFLDYKKSPAPGFPTHLMEVELKGVATALANLTERGAIDPVVKATITLSDSGFIAVTDAVAFGAVKDESITGKLKNLFGSETSSAVEETETGSVENTPPRESDAAAAPEPVSKTEVSIPITLNTLFPTIPPMTVQQKKDSRNRLRTLDAEEAAKSKKEEARNTLEGYLYRLRDLLDEHSKDTPFVQCSQESERRKIHEKLEESFEWLNEHGDVAETSQLLDRRHALETLERPIIHRYQEIEAFPTALNQSQMWNWSTRLFLTEAHQNLTAEQAADLPSKWTKEELDALERTLKDHETWLNTWVEKQKSVKPNQDPVIETTEMKARAKVLEQHLQKLWKRKTPKKPKKKQEPIVVQTGDDQQIPLKAEEDVRDEL